MGVLQKGRRLILEKVQQLRQALRRIVLTLFILLRRIRLPGFRNVGLYDVLKFFVDGLSDARFTLMAAAMAFNFIFALFPTIFLLFTMVAWLPMPDLQERILHFFAQFIPAPGMILIEKIVVDTFSRMGIGLISLNLFLALRSAMMGVLAMMRAFSKDQQVFRQRGFIQTYALALLIVILLAALFVFSIGMLAAGEYLIAYLYEKNVMSGGLELFLLKSLNYLISLFLLIFSISILYYLAPPTHRRWSFFSPGAFMASLLSLLLVVGFGWVFGKFGSWFFSDSQLGSFNAIYSSLAAIILLMLWFYYISIVLLIGFELNTAIDLAALHRHGEGLVSTQKVDPLQGYKEEE